MPHSLIFLLLRLSLCICWYAWYCPNYICLSSFFLILLFFCSSDWTIITDLFASSVRPSSASTNLSFIVPSKFFISDTSNSEFFFYYLCFLSLFLLSFSEILFSSLFYLFRHKFLSSLNIFKIVYWTLAGVAQWIECWPANQRVTNLIPSQGICLGCRPGSPIPVADAWEATTHWSFSTSPSLFLPLSIKINK